VSTKKNQSYFHKIIEKDKNINSFRESLIIVFWYSVFGFLWIVLTDKILEALVTDHELYSRIQLIKGWIFVILTVIMIFLIVRKRIDIIKDIAEKMITATKVLNTTEEELLIQKAITEEIIGKAPVMIVIWDYSGKIKSVNPYTLEVLGYKQSSEIISDWQNLFISSENFNNVLSVFELLKQETRLMNYETELIAKDGHKVYTIWNSGVLEKSSQELKEYVSFGVDITDKKNAEIQLKELAFYDSLTNLPNRVALENEVKNRFANPNDKFALLYLDVDNFKYVNDSLGHHVGDELLRYIADCLSKAVKKPNDFIARLGGDEYAIIIGNYKDRNQVELTVERIKTETGKTWFIYNHNFYISMSVGVAIAGENGYDFMTLSKNADIAMYASKNEGKDRIMFFEEAIEQNNMYHIDMAKKIQKAIENSEFELYYQPIYTLSDQKISGFEALIRWNESIRGFISPAEFIPLAEETGQIYAIERWVLQAALNQKIAWDKLGYVNLSLSINLSSKTLISDTNFASLESTLSDYTGDLRKITLEITETALINDMEKVVVRARRLKDLGVKIALDDFGTGYSSLTHIKVLPIDIVKLDRSFISQIENKGKDELIISSVIMLVKKLGYGLVAEGIENQEQYDYLVKNHCEMGQGFFMNRPLSISKINALLMKK
jgi:diguanylate cyclase (GGDEF)-like protein/PAS domain S-box-containing protein